MDKPIIQADQNLVLNGDFTKSLSHWTKGPILPRWTGVMKDMYCQELTPYLRTGNRSSAYQTLVVPKAIGPNVRYVLSFLYETNHTRAGKVIVSIGPSGPRQEIELPPKTAKDMEQRQVRLAEGQPLALDLTLLESELNLELTAGQTLHVEVSSPQNDAGDETSDIRVTRIELRLHLDLPLQLKELKLDDESLPTEGPLHLCLGADFDSFSGGHRLHFSARDDSDWIGTDAALTIQSNPQGAILARPDWATDQPLDTQWQLSCPLIGNDEPYRFTLQLINQYTAKPYPLDVSLGHHRLVFRETLEAAYYPVLEYGQSVRLGVQVSSYYTSQALAGRTINWTVEDRTVKAASNTDDNGWAYFDYLPTTDGDFTIMASVDSPYYQSGSVSQGFEVKVLATDPWKDVLAVTETGEAPWQDKTGYPNRGASYPLHIKLPDALRGTSLSLTWSGDSPEQLGVTISPPLGEPLPVEEADSLWTLASEDRLDGQFRLQLSCSKLKLPSPLKNMSLARNVVKIGEVREANKSPVVDEEESVLLRVQVLHDVALGDSDPVINALVEWMLPEGDSQRGITGSGGWASVLYAPKSAGNKVITARVKAHADGVAVERDFQVAALESSPWSGQVSILLDNQVVDHKVLGLLCRRGQSHTLKVEAPPGSEWIGRNISLHWRGADPAIGLRVSDLGVSRPLSEEGLTWTLNSSASESLSRLFELKLMSDEVADRELFGRLVSNDLSQEAFVVLDQISVSDKRVLYPCLGAVHRYQIRTNALSPLVGLSALIGWEGTIPEDLGGTVQPDRLEHQLITDSGVSWTFDFSASRNPGQFEVSFGVYGLGGSIGFNPMKLGHNKLRIDSSRESPVDPVIGQEPAWQWIQVVSHFTEQPVEGVPVKWHAGDMASTDADGWSGFGFAPTESGTQQVQATVVSPYDGFETHRSFSVSALASDPWEGLMVRFDAGEFQPWGQKTAFPRRKSNHRMELTAANDNPLLGRQLTLGMTGESPSELDIRFAPGRGLGTPVEFQGVALTYSFDVGDIRDGSFSLRLAADRLASLSPANAMSLGRGTQVLKFASGARVRQMLDWNQELAEQVTLVSSISGKPMVGVEVSWFHADLGTQISLTDFYGVARIRFTPRTPGASVLTATVGDEVYSESVALDFTLNEPREISALYESDDPRQPPDESKAHANAKVVSALTGKPLVGVEVWWEYDGHDLGTSLTDSEGIARLLFNHADQEASVLSATVRGGIAGWDMAQIVYGGERPPIPDLVEITLSSLQVLLGGAVTSSVRVQNAPSGGMSVLWRFPGLPDAITQTDSTGWTSYSFTPKVYPANGFAKIEAFINPMSPNPSTMSTLLWVTTVKNEMTDGAVLFVNKAPITLPNMLVVPVTLGKLQNIGLWLKPDGGFEGHQFSLAVSREDLVLEPAAGMPITIETEFTWTLTPTVPVGTQFALAITSASFEGSVGSRFVVVEPKLASDDLEGQR